VTARQDVCDFFPKWTQIGMFFRICIIEEKKGGVYLGRTISPQNDSGPFVCHALHLLRISGHRLADVQAGVPGRHQPLRF
jgi:hypothetical protein